MLSKSILELLAIAFFISNLNTITVSTEILSSDIDSEINFLPYNVGVLLLNEFRRNSQNFWIHFNGTTPETNAKLYSWVNQLLKYLDGVPVHVGHCNNTEQYYNLHTRVFFVDSVFAFSELVERKNVEAIQSEHVRYLVILEPLATVKRPAYAEMREIFSIMLDMLMLNIDIAIQTHSTEIQFYSFYPYSVNDCQSTTPILEYTLNADESKDPALPHLDNLFKSKLKDMNGCSLSVVLYSRPPFIVLDYKKNGSLHLSGAEGILLKQIGANLNFTLEIMVSNKSTPDNVYTNGTTTGVYKLLQKRHVNLTLGDLSYSAYRMGFFTSSFSHQQNNVHILIKRTSSYTPIEVVLYPYRKDTWILFGAIYLIRLLMFRFPAGRLLQEILPRNFQRFLLIMWLILLFEVRSGYEGRYFQYMNRRPSKPLPRKIRELRTQGYTIISSSLEDNALEAIAIAGLKHKEYNLPWDAMYGILNNSTGFYGIPTKEEYLQIYSDKLSKFYLVEEPLLMDILCIYFPRFTFLVEAFDDVILRFRSAGLVDKVFNDFTHPKHFSRYSQLLKIQNVNSEFIEMLTLHHLQGIFLLFISLAVASIFVFFIERFAINREELHWIFERLI